ncbi:TPA: hypothetical protein EYN65_20650 [Candidatus Poribacteria bacterium]|nr:hypothetical protein [Candidatus Poribacteria bacterium]
MKIITPFWHPSFCAGKLYDVLYVPPSAYYCRDSYSLTAFSASGVTPVEVCGKLQLDYIFEAFCICYFGEGIVEVRNLL